jgi:hypothetical protein
MDFPDNPISNETYSYAGKTWEWDGEKWNIMWTSVGFMSEDPVVILDDPYQDEVDIIAFDPTQLPLITKN